LLDLDGLLLKRRLRSWVRSIAAARSSSDILGGQSKPTGQGQLKIDQWSVGSFKTDQ
jgi:hypothetical protein